jgi:NADH-quinone oxidoreductase subunit E
MSKASEQGVCEVEQIVGQYGGERGSLIPILQDIQDKFGYLSEEAVDALAGLMNVSPNEIYGVATFYAQFRFRPPGEHTIHVCQGTACHVRGGHQILSEVERRLKIKTGETTADGKFDLERVACLGCCALAPVVAVDGHVNARMTPRKIPTVLAMYRGEEDNEKA